jgi:hypothetical protein
MLNYVITKLYYIILFGTEYKRTLAFFSKKPTVFFIDFIKNLSSLSNMYLATGVLYTDYFYM